MSVTPYEPSAFTTPVVNPAVGGAGAPVPYVSNSMYANAPTAMDVLNLVPGGNAQAQAQALADTLRRAAAWADRYCFGQDMAAKGASLAATQSVEAAQVRVVNGELRLICDYKPIISVTGVDIGPDMSSLSSVGASVAASIRIARRTIHVPVVGFVGRDGSAINPPYAPVGRYMAVWSYVNGYPHSALAASVVAGATTLTLQPTDGAAGLLGMIPNATQLRIVDGESTETITVKSVTGTTVTATTALRYAHTAPNAPDFLPVTALPAEVEQAVIFMTTALIKTRGDNAIVLDDLVEPKQVRKTAGDEWSDVDWAMQMLRPYRVRMKDAR